MISGWGVTQEVLPKQAPEAAETNGKRDDIEKREKKERKKKKKTEAELCWNDSAIQVQQSDKAAHIQHTLKQHKRTCRLTEYTIAKSLDTMTSLLK